MDHVWNWRLSLDHKSIFPFHRRQWQETAQAYGTSARYHPDDTNENQHLNSKVRKAKKVGNSELNQLISTSSVPELSQNIYSGLLLGIVWMEMDYNIRKNRPVFKS